MEDLSIPTTTGGTSAEAHTAAAEKPWLEAYADIEGFHKESFEKFNDDKERGVVKSYIELQKRLGSAINIPEEGDSEAWTKLYAKLGRPESAEQYELPSTEGVSRDEAYQSAIQKVAFENGLNRNQLVALAQANDAYILEATKGQQEATDKLNNARMAKLGWTQDQTAEAAEHLRRRVVEFSEKYPPPEGDQSLAELMLDKDGKFSSNDPLMLAFTNFCMDNPTEDKGIIRGNPATGVEEGWKPAPGPETYWHGTDPDSVKARAWHESQGYDFDTKQYVR